MSTLYKCHFCKKIFGSQYVFKYVCFDFCNVNICDICFDQFRENILKIKKPICIKCNKIIDSHIKEISYIADNSYASIDNFDDDIDAKFCDKCYKKFMSDLKTDITLKDKII